MDGRARARYKNAIRVPRSTARPNRRRRWSDGAYVKTTKGRPDLRARQIPVHIRSSGGDLPSEDRAYIRRKLGRRLGKFASSIERVSVRTRDVNGPRGGVDQMCRIKVVLSGLPSVVFESRSTSLKVAVDRALAGTERVVRRAVQRRRMKRLRRSAAEVTI